MHVYFYVVLVIIVSLILFNAYLKIKYPFWSKQPVFHFHYLHYYFKNDNYILNDSSQMNINKFINLNNIKIINYDEEKQERKHNFLIEIYFSLIQRDYFKTDFSIFKPSYKYLYDILNTQCSYIALYTTYKPKYNNQKQLFNCSDVVSGLTSKLIYFHRYNKNKQNKTLHINYVDFLCTDKEYRKKNLTPKVIYTYARDIMLKNEKQNNSKGNIFVFKREGEKQSFVPFTVYSNFVFDLKYFNYRENDIHQNKQQNIKLEKICGSNFELMFRTFELMKEQQINILHVPIETIKHYIETDIIHIYISHHNSEPLSIYIYKNNCFYYGGKLVFELMSSYIFNQSSNSALYNMNFFTEFFKKSLFDLVDKSDIGFINIENLSMNNEIIKHMREKYTEVYKYTNNFYLYNYILNPIKSTKILMII